MGLPCRDDHSLPWEGDDRHVVVPVHHCGVAWLAKQPAGAENDRVRQGRSECECDQLWPLYMRSTVVATRVDHEANSADDTTESGDETSRSLSQSTDQALAMTEVTSLVEHVYTDEYFTTLDVEKVGDFFRWVGVYK